MSFGQLSPKLFVSPQVGRAEIEAAAAQGIRTLICNRPEGEEPGQPSTEQLRQWAAEAGIEHFIHQPVVAPQIQLNDAKTFAEAVAQSHSPVLAFCRTGTRSSILWALAEAAAGADPQQLLQTAAAAGIDLSTALPRLEAARP